MEPTTTKRAVLSDADIQQFIEKGFVVIREAFSREQVDEWTASVWTRLGFDKDDPETWTSPRTHMPTHHSEQVRTFAPRAWEAICQLCGGEERVEPSNSWGDGFIVNLGTPNDHETWVPPSPTSGGWHADGDFFKHFLDSPEQGLLTIVLWSGVVPTGGATFIATDSVGPVARKLAAHTEGLAPNGFGFTKLIAECHDFAEATGKAGDVYLIHPFLLHASSQNALRLPRLITNPTVRLKEPMNFNRADPADFSPVERAVLHGLGVERLAFEPTSPRERVVPQRAIMQAKMKEEEAARLTGAAVS